MWKLDIHATQVYQNNLKKYLIERTGRFYYPDYFKSPTVFCSMKRWPMFPSQRARKAINSLCWEVTFCAKPICWCLICQHWHDKYVERCHFKADSRIAPGQWETVLLCNDVSHWLGAILESSLICNIQIFCSLFSFYINICPFQVYTYIKNLNSLSTPQCMILIFGCFTYDNQT